MWEELAMKAAVCDELKVKNYPPQGATAASPPTAPLSTLTSGLERLQKANVFAAELADRAAKAADALCGAMPQPDGCGASRDGVYAVVPILHSQIDNIGAVLARLAGELDRIERVLA